MVFDDFKDFLASQKSRDIIGIHPIADRIGGNYQLKDAFDSYEVTIFICVSSIDWYSTAL